MDAYEKGWEDGTLDIDGPWNPNPDPGLTPDERADYLEGYREARKGWDR